MVPLLTYPALLASPIDIDRGRARREAAQELLRSEYAKESLIDRAIRAVDQFLGDLLDQQSIGIVGSVTAWAVLAVIVAAAVVAVVMIARRVSRNGTAHREGIFGDRRRTAAEHREAAERLAGEGRWAEAVRERLRAVARDLEDRAIVDSMPGRTADELAAEAGRALPEFAAELTAAARVFDDVTYGEVPGTAEAYGVLRDLDGRLRTARPALGTATEAASS
ncbi:DUF4129 domain-containing protein [Streptosporangium sp. NPDC087985]|uniref:DUF4129 domain-containing protein n=1 Tax=Streptosporangium sp. NPDC087985 TaxID=3366196 RepID=UPI00382E5D3F